ncbi:hypothetical protein SUDANB52_04283 [Streptomyces sp. SudanB52_2052]
MESDRFVTDLGGPGDHRARRPDDGPEVVAAQIAAAVESLTDLWSVAAQEASLRLSPHQLRALRIVQAAPGLNLTTLADRLDIGLPRPAGSATAWRRRASWNASRTRTPAARCDCCSPRTPDTCWATSPTAGQRPWPRPWRRWNRPNARP